MIWPDNAAVSVLVLAVIAMAFMYAARAPMHALIRSLGHALGGPLRMGSRWLAAAAAEIHQRNKAARRSATASSASSSGWAHW
jgi:hypothetical protein